MSREPHIPRDENPHQGPSHSFGIPAASRAPERERSIDTGRDTGRATLGPRRSGSPQPYTAVASPFGVMRRMVEDMDRLFEDFAFGHRAWPSGLFDAGGRQVASTGWSPEIETFRRGDKLVVRADLPGLRKEDVKIEIDDGVLTIEGERTAESKDEGDGYFRSERSYGQFARSIPLPDGVDSTKCDASFKDGVLEVTLPAPQQAERKARRVEIK